MRKDRLGKIGTFQATGRTADLQEVRERAWNNVREIMRHVPGSAFHAPIAARGDDKK